MTDTPENNAVAAAQEAFGARINGLSGPKINGDDGGGSRRIAPEAMTARTMDTTGVGSSGVRQITTATMTNANTMASGMILGPALAACVKAGAGASASTATGFDQTVAGFGSPNDGDQGLAGLSPGFGSPSSGFGGFPNPGASGNGFRAGDPDQWQGQEQAQGHSQEQGQSRPLDGQAPAEPQTEGVPGPQGWWLDRAGAELAFRFGPESLPFSDQLAAAAGRFEAQRTLLAAALADHQLPPADTPEQCVA